MPGGRELGVRESQRLEDAVPELVRERVAGERLDYEAERDVVGV